MTQNANPNEQKSIIKGTKTLLNDSNSTKINTGKAGLQIATGKLSNDGVKYIIHAVGPIWGNVNNESTIKLLKDAIIDALNIAKNRDEIKKIAIPTISGGIFTKTINQQKIARKILVETVFEWLFTNDTKITNINLYDWNPDQTKPQAEFGYLTEAFDEFLKGKMSNKPLSESRLSNTNIQEGGQQLCDAVSSNNIGEVKELVTRFGNNSEIINYNQNPDKATPLHIAVYNKNLKMVETLLDALAINLELLDVFNNNPLQMAKNILDDIKNNSTIRANLKNNLTEIIKLLSKKMKNTVDEKIQEIIAELQNQRGGQKLELSQTDNIQLDETHKINEEFYNKYIPIEWQTVLTIGDGSCLIHAFLLALSPTYRKLQNDANNKGAVGSIFRKELGKNPKFTQYIKNKSKNNINKLYSGSADLDDDDLKALLKYFGLNCVLLIQSTNSVIEYKIPQQLQSNKTIILYNTENPKHYSLVKPNEDSYLLNENITSILSQTSDFLLVNNI